MAQDKISVIMPVYNVEEKLLREAIESIIAQSYTNLELIIIDDGSFDICGAVCDEYAKQDFRLKVIHEENQGVSSARNRGLQLAIGQYIAFIDADDSVQKKYLEYLHSLICMSNSDMAACSCEYVLTNHKNPIQQDGRSLKTDEISQREAIELLCYQTQLYHGLEMTAVWGKLYRKNIVRDIQFDKGMAIGEDFIFNCRCYLEAQRIIVSNYKGYNYRIRQSSLMNSSFNKSKIGTIDVVRNFKAEFSTSKYKSEIIARITNIAIVIYLMIPPDHQYEKEKNKVIKFINEDRYTVLLNKKIKKKMKMALLISYLGYDKMQKIYTLFSKKHKS